MGWYKFKWLGFGVALLGLSTSVAHAQLLQPAAPEDPKPLFVPRLPSGGDIGDAQTFNPTVPQAGNYVSLQALFDYRGENIDAQADAATSPGTFVPLSGASATLVLRAAGCQMGFAWYNLLPNRTPGPLNEVLSWSDPNVYSQPAFAPLATDGPWTLRPLALVEPQDARYKGGEIGFALLAHDRCSQNKYSQLELSTDCITCTPVAPFITAIVYESTLRPHAYYLAFEDLPISPIAFFENNDGDYNDFVFYLENVCAGENCEDVAGSGGAGGDGGQGGAAGQTGESGGAPEEPSNQAGHSSVGGESGHAAGAPSVEGGVGGATEATGGSSASGGSAPGGEDGSCSCRHVGAPSHSFAPLWLSALLIAARRRRPRA